MRRPWLGGDRRFRAGRRRRAICDAGNQHRCRRRKSRVVAAHRQSQTRRLTLTAAGWMAAALEPAGVGMLEARQNWTWPCKDLRAVLRCAPRALASTKAILLQRDAAVSMQRWTSRPSNSPGLRNGDAARRVRIQQARGGMANSRRKPHEYDPDPNRGEIALRVIAPCKDGYRRWPSIRMRTPMRRRARCRQLLRIGLAPARDSY